MLCLCHTRGLVGKMETLALAEPTERLGHRELAEHTEPAKLRTRMRMGEKGRLVIPAALREALAMADEIAGKDSTITVIPDGVSVIVKK